MYIFRLYFVSSKLIDPLLKGKSIEIGEEEGEGGVGNTSTINSRMMDNKSQGIRKQELAGVGYTVDRGIVWFTLV